MTPAERNLHRILADFAALPGVVERATIYRERCGVCGGSGQCATSTWDRPQVHLGRCGACAGAGFVVREPAP